LSTIVAQSTPPLASAIAVIRLSGENALSITAEAFSGFKGKVEPRRAYYGTFNAGKVKDDCVALYFAAPHSYTGEDVVEISCHGSVAVTTAILEFCLSKGARLAERGEFTRRAFENGKLDLTESEAVIDLINAQSESEARSAYDQLSGSLSRIITSLQDAVTTTIAKSEAAIDYPEEDVEEFTSVALKGDLEGLLSEVKRLKGTYNAGKIMRDGVRVAIIGKPNAGKSMLLNALLGYERSIVSGIAGTTRDYVEESFNYKDMRFRLTDTAGIRETGDVVEKRGVELSLDKARAADIVLLIIEAGEEAEIPENLGRVILVENKIDISQPKGANTVKISALTGENMDLLKEELYSAAKGLTAHGGGINNLRHLEAVTNAEECLLRAEQSLLGGMPLDLICDDLMGAYRALGSITGITSSDKIVGEIFSRFCVGK